MQLVAYGAQDIYLTGNPQITFFKVVYRRHTNFSMECIRQTINGSSATSGSATTGNVTISRNGDLVHRVYVTSSSDGITDGSKIVQEAELEIGGQRIDRHYMDWNDAWNELSTDESKALGLKSMQGCIGTTSSSTGGAAVVGQLNLVQVPLNFWFCRNPGLALPLIALQYHEVKVKVTFGASLSVTGSAASPAACEVWCDYIYLDTDERRRFAQVSHEYLIEQIQRQTETLTATNDFSLNFNHPVKELVWTYPATTTFDGVQLKLNGHDRFAEQNEPYFTLRQPYDYHSAVPRQNLPTSAQTAGPGSLLGLQMSTLQAVDGAQTGVFVTTGGTLDLGVASTTLLSDSGINASTALNITAADGPVQIAIVQGDASDASQVGQAGALDNGDVGNVYIGTVTFSDADNCNIVSPFVTVFSADAAGIAPGTTNITIARSAGTGGVWAVYRISTDATTSMARTSQMTRKIGVYSFALKPEEHQPSGTCNFSRIDNAQLHGDAAGTIATSQITVYAVNYNVLRIMSGMGGLAYSN